MNHSNPVFIPGPTNLPESVRRAIDQPTIDHRSPAFAQSIPRLFAGLRSIVATEAGHIFIFPGTGTGGWEATIANTLSKGDRVLACRHGVFSDKWIRMCEAFGLIVDVIECDWTGPADPTLIEAALRADQNQAIKAVLATHNETATGVRSDLKAIRESIDRAGHGALFFVDGVSSIASMDFQMDAWGIDAAVTGSQKGLMLPAGLAIVAVSDKAMEAGKTADLPRFFFDFKQMAQMTHQGGFPYTPPMQLLAGLQHSVDLLLTEGLDAVFSRHFKMGEGVRQAAAAWNLDLCCEDLQYASDTVTTIMVPEGFNADRLVEHAYTRYGMSFGVGLGKLAGQAFRIGHLGMLSESQALSGLAVIEMAMRDLDYPIVSGSGVAAAQEWYRSALNADAMRPVITAATCEDVA
ncbi:MAG: aminotransferase class V-fold PLP-dependent enzyme [Oceanospirillales bacterium]|jgi:alanine-glyoxylate transaminase/serine-glyoxylate transaminase/serine-pyruvate transaminase|nr:aminotransferase class V-fold PLP-dependent enzyme [Oceanospirillales bacterium]HAB68896.1 serine--glyoxylate aminotransferase [Gammaproteobacteria bacterium]